MSGKRERKRVSPGAAPNLASPKLLRCRRTEAREFLGDPRHDEVILSKGKAQVWFKDKKCQVFVPAGDALQQISEMRNLADPKVAFERLQAAKAAGQVQVVTKQPATDSEPIVLTVTSKTKPDRREVYEVIPKAKLAERITDFRRRGENWEQVALFPYLDSNQPIDPKVFQPEMPEALTVIDQISRKSGPVKGDLPDDPIAEKVVREVFEALIAADYDKAGVIYEAIPDKALKERFEETKFLRVIELGKPAPNPSMKALRVPATVEIEIKTRREVKDFSPWVRPAAGQPDRRVICSGISRDRRRRISAGFAPGQQATRRFGSMPQGAVSHPARSATVAPAGVGSSIPLASRARIWKTSHVAAAEASPSRKSVLLATSGVRAAPARHNGSEVEPSIM